MSKEKTFEINLNRLEAIVSALESPELSLEEGMTLYKEGIKCAQLCGEKLQKAKHELEIWQKETGVITHINNNEISNENLEQEDSQNTQGEFLVNETLNAPHKPQTLYLNKPDTTVKQNNSDRITDNDFGEVPF